MSLRNTTLIGAALCALASSVAAQSGGPDRPAAPSAAVVNPAGIARASVLMGKHVVDAAGKTVGEVKDFIACDSGELVVLIERVSDDKLVGAPMSVLTPRVGAKADRTAADAKADATLTDTANVENFTISAGSKLATAPVVADRDQIDPAWWNDFMVHYGMQQLDKSEPAGSKAARGMMPAGHAGAVCIATLIGQDVKSAAGEDLGDVKDVAVSLADGKVAYVVISTGGVLGMNTTLHGVGFASLVPDTERKFVTLQTDTATLARTTGINIDKLPTRPNFEVAATAPSKTDRPDKASGGSR